MQHNEASTMEKGLALPRGRVPQSDQAQLACLSRDNSPAGTSQGTYIVGTAQQMPLHTCAACADLHKSMLVVWNQALLYHLSLSTLLSAGAKPLHAAAQV